MTQRFHPTPAARRYVAAAAGAWMRHGAIACGLGISRPTLYKYFSAELTIVAAARRLDVICALYDAAIKGRVSAQRLYLRRKPEGAARDERRP